MGYLVPMRHSNSWITLRAVSAMPIVDLPRLERYLKHDSVASGRRGLRMAVRWLLVRWGRGRASLWLRAGVILILLVVELAWVGLGLGTVPPVNLTHGPGAVSFGTTVSTGRGSQSSRIGPMTGAGSNAATSTAPSTVAVGSYPDAVAYDSGNGDVYIANGDSGNVSVVDGATGAVIRSISVGSEPGAVAYDVENGNIYVANAGSSNLSVVNGPSDKVVGSIPVGTDPEAIAYDTINGYLYVVNCYSFNVSVIDGASNAVIKWIPVGSNPAGIAFDPSNGYLYVADRGSHNVTVINGATEKRVKSIPVGFDPSGIGYDSDNGYVYVTHPDRDDLTVINGTTDSVVGTIATGERPDSVVADATNGIVYVPNYWSKDVAVLNGSTDQVVLDVPVGNLPDALAYDSGSGYLFVSNGGSDSVSIIDARGCASCKASFNESGLPARTRWWVNLTDGQSFSSLLPTISFKEPNGTYHFSIATTDKEYQYRALGESGSTVVVYGSEATKALKFTRVTYRITFTESGLPSGTEWWVNLTNGRTLHSTHSTLSFGETNATYGYTTSSANASYAGESGNFTVNGGVVAEAVQFRLDPKLPELAGASSFPGVSRLTARRST